MTFTSCKSHYETSKTNSSIVKTVVEAQISDSIKVALDSIVFKVASANTCRISATIKGVNSAAYYSGFDGRENKKITNFSELFEIGSCSKMLTVATIMQLVEQGKLTLDDKLTTVLPNKNLYKDLLVIDGKDYIDSVKVVNLLNHSSGFPDYFLDNEVEEVALHSNPLEIFTPEQLIYMAKQHIKKPFVPGSSFKYCNVNYILLGMIIEKLTNVTYQNYIQEHILNPLNLKNTYFGSQYPLEQRPKGHYNGKVTLMPFTLAYSAGEIISDLDDMQTFIKAWNQGVLFKNPATLETLKTENFKPMIPGLIRYGLGVIDLNGMSLGHAGQTFGFQAYIGSINSNQYTFALVIDEATVPAWDPAFEISMLLNTIK